LPAFDEFTTTSPPLVPEKIFNAAPDASFPAQLKFELRIMVKHIVHYFRVREKKWGKLSNDLAKNN